MRSDFNHLKWWISERWWVYWSFLRNKSSGVLTERCEGWTWPTFIQFFSELHLVYSTTTKFPWTFHFHFPFWNWTKTPLKLGSSLYTCNFPVTNPPASPPVEDEKELLAPAQLVLEKFKENAEAHWPFFIQRCVEEMLYFCQCFWNTLLFVCCRIGEKVSLRMAKKMQNIHPIFENPPFNLWPCHWFLGSSIGFVGSCNFQKILHTFFLPRVPRWWHPPAGLLLALNKN